MTLRYNFCSRRGHCCPFPGKAGTERHLSSERSTTTGYASTRRGATHDTKCQRYHTTTPTHGEQFIRERSVCPPVSLKAMFYAVNKVGIEDGQRIAAYQLWQIAKVLTSGELLLLKTIHDNASRIQVQNFQLGPTNVNEFSVWPDA